MEGTENAVIKKMNFGSYGSVLMSFICEISLQIYALLWMKKKVLINLNPIKSVVSGMITVKNIHNST